MTCRHNLSTIPSHSVVGCCRFFNYEGRADSRIVRKVVMDVAPRALVVARGAHQARADLCGQAARELAGLGTRVGMPGGLWLAGWEGYFSELCVHWPRTSSLGWAHTWTCTCTHTHTHTTYMHTYTCMRMRTHVNRRTHLPTWSRTHTHACTHTHTYAHAHVDRHTCIHTGSGAPRVARCCACCAHTDTHCVMCA